MTTEPLAARPAASNGNVQSVERAFDLLERMAEAGGDVTLSGLSKATDLPIGTIHRLVRTLVRVGCVRQVASNRHYALGPRLIRLGQAAGMLLDRWIEPHLNNLVNACGETANVALLDRDEILYLGQVPSPHLMRMFTEVGRRVSPHCTGVGKAVLAQLPDTEVFALLARTGLPARTVHTITDPRVLAEELRLIRERGYALDEAEQELGVRCVAVPIPTDSMPLGLSISGPEGRMTTTLINRMVPIMQESARKIAATLDSAG